MEEGEKKENATRPISLLGGYNFNSPMFQVQAQKDVQTPAASTPTSPCPLESKSKKICLISFAGSGF